MRALPQLQAERQISATKAATFPHMTPQAQRETMRDLGRLVGSDQKREQATQATLAASGITVEYVDAEGRPVAAGTAQDGTEG